MIRSVYCRRGRTTASRLFKPGRLCGWVLLCHGLSAQGAGFSDTFQVHGFASQALITTSDNDFFGNTDDNVSLGFTELGLNVSVRPLPRLQLSAQGLSRRAGKGDEGHDGSIQLDYALADFSLISNETNQFGIRLGRIKNPLGLYMDTRDVAFTRPSIFLPQSIYFDSTRTVALSGDGGTLYAEHRSDVGNFFLQLGAGFPQSNQDVELDLFSKDQPGKLQDRLSYVGRFMYEWAGGRVRLAVSAAQVNLDYDPALPSPPDLPPGSNRFSPVIFSAQYNAERWSVTGEYALRPLKFSDFGPTIDRTATGESYYLQGTYRFARRWEGLLRYDVYYLDRDDRNGSDLAASSSGRPAHSAFAKDWTVGVRWDVTDSFMLRAEYHDVDGTGWLPVQDNLPLGDTKRHWNLFAILASYRF